MICVSVRPWLRVTSTPLERTIHIPGACTFQLVALSAFFNSELLLAPGQEAVNSLDFLIVSKRSSLRERGPRSDRASAELPTDWPYLQRPPALILGYFRVRHGNSKPTTYPSSISSWRGWWSSRPPNQSNNLRADR